MYTLFITESVKSTLGTTLILLENFPKLSLELPKISGELLTIQDLYMQELIEYASVLQSKISTIEGTEDKWLKFYTSLSAKQKSEAEEGYKDMLANQWNLIKILDMARDKLAVVKARIDITQKVIDRLLRSESQTIDEGTGKQWKSKLKLPDLPILMFDGNVPAWPRFWSSFQRAVCNQDLNDGDKLNYLVGALKGKPARLVSGYIIKEENYERVVKILKETYGQTDMITSYLRRKLKELQPMRTENEFRDKIMAVEEILQRLESSGENVNDSNTEIMIEEKLSFGILNQVYVAKSADAEWNVTKLRSFLRKMVINQEKVAYILQKYNLKPVRFENLKLPSRESKQHATSAFNYSGNKIRLETKSCNKKSNQDQKRNKEKYQLKWCAFCNGEHFHNKCPVYADVKDRFKRIKELSLCTRCLRKGHVEKICKASIKPCYYCGKLHHGALCEEIQKKERIREMTTHTIVSSEGTEGKSFLPELTSAEIMSKSQEISLRCKGVELANSTDPKLKKETLVFLDPGSHHYYVASKLAAELRLPVKAQSKRANNQLYSLKIGESLHSQEKIEESGEQNAEKEASEEEAGATYFQYKSGNKERKNSNKSTRKAVGRN